MLPYIFAFAAVVSGARVQQRQDSCSSTVTLDTLSVTTVEPISIYILPARAVPTGTTNDNNNEDPFIIVYQTVYATFCPNCPSGGLQPKTYTVTQTCTGPIAACRPSGTVLPAGFKTTQATCTNCPTPSSAVLTVPDVPDVVVTQTVLETVTEGGLTATRTVVQTFTTASSPSGGVLSAISYTGRVGTFDAGIFAEPATATATATVVVTEERTATATATMTRDANGRLRPVGLSSGAGRFVSADKMLAYGASAFALLLLASS
ncbi:hypothetical protein LX32DRAFT_633391 [Colletotrichum zoysiae]|uniref:Uncharacterized protein n=1 Tax=Colletotrichum zoysiae TaxID=1216348 RepID=A0AAD9HW17_9PEZI|nr:hypothetical protein LX32DRAFT_633391 [Colletotrichum zoysiae]